MAIQAEIISVVIPLSNIEKCKEIGGVKGTLDKHINLLGGKILVDDYLYSEGTMEIREVSSILEFWQAQGLQLQEQINGKPVWKDICVIDSSKGPSIPCDWLEFDKQTKCFWLKDKPKGNLVTMRD